jgi:pimeloyl-ACP methyl ester carboxylesterase
MYQFIKKENYQLSYQIFGSGSLKMLAFHGYGQDSNTFQTLQTAFPLHTIYSIDLFFHGQSEWKDSLNQLDLPTWKAIINSLLIENQIDSFDLIGFSMGGRMSLVTTSLFPSKVKNLYLLAPDGIEANAWYRVATKFSPLQHIFKYFTHYPTPIYRKVISGLTKYRIVHKTVLRLAESEMSSPEKRKRVYQTWMLYRFLEADLKQLAKRINENQIPVQVSLGRYDRLINMLTIKPLTCLLTNISIDVLECGHHKLIAVFQEKLLKNPPK